MAGAWALALSRGLRPAPPPLVTTSVLWNPGVVALIQERTLARVYRDSLYPKLLFRMETAHRGPAHQLQGDWLADPS